MYICKTNHSGWYCDQIELRISGKKGTTRVEMEEMSYPRGWSWSWCKVFGWLPLQANNRLSASHLVPSLDVINSKYPIQNIEIPRNDRVLSLMDIFT